MMVSVAFQGVAGANSEAAIRLHFGDQVTPLPCETFDQIFKAVESGQAQYGMLPVENSLAGTVARSYELLMDYDLRIQAEVILRIRYELLAPPGTKLADIKRVRSHPQALAQCDKYLKRHGFAPVVWFDTAGSARDLAQNPEPHTAALASALAGKLYGLESLESDVEDEADNFTRFFVLGHGDAPPGDHAKTSLVFSVQSKPGTLYDCLGEFATRGINLTKIESKPRSNRAWQYWFYLDFDGHFQDPLCAEALLGVLRRAALVKILGSYPAAVQPGQGESIVMSHMPSQPKSHTPGQPLSVLRCINCGNTHALNEPVYTCSVCGGLLDVEHDLEALRPLISRALFDSRLGALDKPYNSGVWRFKELVFPDAPPDQIVTRGEGNTTLYDAPRKLAAWIGADHLALKHEGENPTGSFKDRGMTGGVTHAVLVNSASVVCASTGNTSASMASYAALAGLQALVFFPYGNIAMGKLAQSIAYGALSVQVRGDFDVCLDLVRQSCRQFGIYLLNSVNPFRLEGQKTIVFEILQQRRWRVPDWIVLPGGNLGNTSAFGKGLQELYTLGLIDHLPRIAVVQAAGAAPFYASYKNGFTERMTVKAETLATAIKIGNPASYVKARRTLEWTNGVVESVTDQEILDAKAQVDLSGIGCEPASAASVAGVKKLIAAGMIRPDEDVVAILTGHVLKDPGIVIDYHGDGVPGLVSTYPNRLRVIDPTLEDVRALLIGEHIPAN